MSSLVPSAAQPWPGFEPLGKALGFSRGQVHELAISRRSGTRLKPRLTRRLKPNSWGRLTIRLKSYPNTPRVRRGSSTVRIGSAHYSSLW